VELPRRKEGIELVYENARRSLGIAEQEQGEGRALLADAVRLQLTLRKVQRRVGAARLQQWVAHARTSVPVEYADGRRP
jgi:sugar diacid utilization regulator